MWMKIVGWVVAILIFCNVEHESINFLGLYAAHTVVVNSANSYLNDMTAKFSLLQNLQYMLWHKAIPEGSLLILLCKAMVVLVSGISTVCGDDIKRNSLKLSNDLLHLSSSQFWPNERGDKIV